MTKNPFYYARIVPRESGGHNRKRVRLRDPETDKWHQFVAHENDKEAGPWYKVSFNLAKILSKNKENCFAGKSPQIFQVVTEDRAIELDRIKQERIKKQTSIMNPTVESAIDTTSNDLSTNDLNEAREKSFKKRGLDKNGKPLKIANFDDDDDEDCIGVDTEFNSDFGPFDILPTKSDKKTTRKPARKKRKTKDQK